MTNLLYCLLLAVVASSTFGCKMSGRFRSVDGLEKLTESEIRSQIIRNVGIGSDRSRVVTYMKSRGFRCREVEDGVYRYRDGLTNEKIEMANQDYIGCARTDTLGLVDQTTIVDFLLADGKTSEVIVSREFMGP
jgi:hypothetical protein